MGCIFNDGLAAEMTSLSIANNFSSTLFGGKPFALTFRIKFPDATARDQNGAVFSITDGAKLWYVYWNGTTHVFHIILDAGTTPGEWTLDPGATTHGTEYDVVIGHTGVPTAAAGAAFGYLRATSAGSAGLTSSAMTAVLATLGAGTTTTSGQAFWFGNDSVDGTPLNATVRDLGLFEGSGTTSLSAADIELFGKGAAPFQLASATLRVCPRMIGTTAYDATPGQAATMTVGGTVDPAALASQDGPLYDFDANALGSTFSGNLCCRYNADAVIYTSAGRIVELPDLSGGLAHAFNATTANQAKRQLNRWGQAEVVCDREVAAKNYSTRGGAVGNVFATGNGISMAWVGGTNAPSGQVSSYLTHLLWVDESTPAAYAVMQISHSANSTGNLRLSLNASFGTQSPIQTPTVTNGVHFVSWTGTTGTGNATAGVNGTSDAVDITSNQKNRYVYRVLYSTDTGDTGCATVDRTREIWGWAADKSASWSATIWPVLKARHGIRSDKGAFGILSASSETGTVASLGRFYITQSRKIRDYRVANWSIGGEYPFNKRMTGCDVSSAVLGDTITVNSSAGTGTVLYADDTNGQIAVYGATGTWATSGTFQINGGSAKNYTGLPLSVTNSITGNVAQVYNYFNQFPATQRRVLLLNPAGNAFAEAQTPIATGRLIYGCLVSWISLIRAGLTSTSNFRVLVRMHQPTASADGATCGAQWADYKARLYGGVGTAFQALVDVSTLPQFDDYIGTTDTGDTSEYYDTFHTLGGDDSDVHGQFRWVALLDRTGVVWPEGGGMLSRKRVRVRFSRSRT